MSANTLLPVIFRVHLVCGYRILHAEYQSVRECKGTYLIVLYSTFQKVLIYLTWRSRQSGIIPGTYFLRPKRGYRDVSCAVCVRYNPLLGEYHPLPTRYWLVPHIIPEVGKSANGEFWKEKKSRKSEQYCHVLPPSKDNERPPLKVAAAWHFETVYVAVSYTHLTLPTIYSV